MSYRKVVAGVLAAAITLLLIEVLPLGSWLTSRSDALWWAVLPWLLIVVIWVVMIRTIRDRSPAAGEREEGQMTDHR